MINLNTDLIKNMELFIKVFNNLTDLFYLMEVVGEESFNYMLVNEPAKQFTGLTEEAYGRPMEEFISQPSANFIKQKYRMAIETKNTISYEDIKYQSNNQPTYWESKITPIYSIDGACTHIFVVARDITERKLKEKEIKKVKERFELIWNSAADAVFTIDTNAEIVSVNAAFTKLLGWTEEELLNNQTISIIPEDYKEDIDEVLTKVKSGEIIPYHTVQRITKEGILIDVLASYSPVFEDDNRCVGAIVMYKDITEQTKYQQQLRDSEAKYRLIAEHSSDLIKLVDKEGMILYASPSHMSILEKPPEYYLNKSILSFVHADEVAIVKNCINQIINNEQSESLEVRKLNDKGQWIWFETIGTPVFNDKGKVIRIVFEARNITERKEYEHKLERLALFDYLTGLPNRVMFTKQLKKELEQANLTNGNLAIMFMDLDKFKKINDTMGHDIGDELLRAFGGRVSSCLRTKDSLSRLGGDEFVILLPDLKEEQEAYDIANCIIQSLQAPWEIGEYKFHTTSSIGIAFYQPFSPNQKMLLKNADIALYQAKKKGRNNYQVYLV